jgi:hypothetical protein
MATAERMAESIQLEGQGISALLWDAKEDLVRTLLVLNAALHDVPKRSLLLTPGDATVCALRQAIETRVLIAPEDREADGESDRHAAQELWLFYLQQASSEVVGPWLNGWRVSLCLSPGTVCVIRHADFQPFQRHAPDLASFIGPRIYNASTMLSLVSPRAFERLRPTLPEADAEIVAALPGAAPPEDELRGWIAACAPTNDE